MKKIALLCLGTILFYACQEDNDRAHIEIPSVVLNSFHTKFSNVHDVEWKFVNEGYEVEFEIKNIEHKAFFTDNGTMPKHRYEITVEELPSAIKDSIAGSYPNLRIDEPGYYNFQENEFYQVELEGRNDLYKVFYPNGSENDSIPYWD